MNEQLMDFKLYEDLDKFFLFTSHVDRCILQVAADHAAGLIADAPRGGGSGPHEGTVVPSFWGGCHAGAKDEHVRPEKGAAREWRDWYAP